MLQINSVLLQPPLEKKVMNVKDSFGQNSCIKSDLPEIEFLEFLQLASLLCL